MMDMDDYQQSTRETAKFPNAHMPPQVYCALGLADEAGETLGKLKKLYRDKDGVITPEFVDAITLEMGDVLWYLASLAYEMGIPLSTVAVRNQEKFRDRKARNKIHGDGDNR